MNAGLVAACSVPQPPLLLPGMTGRSVAEVEQLRSACLTAVDTMLRARPDRVVVVGPASVDPLGAGPVVGEPLSMRVGRALLAGAGCDLPVGAVTVEQAATAADCLALGREIAAGDDRIGLLVLGDGSARRGLKAPGYLDERAAAVDAAVLAALTAPDWRQLAELDTALAAELLIAGRPSWQVLAGALDGRVVQTTLRYADDPFGVFYPVLDYRVLAHD
jgi:hypothetical protein